MIRVLIAERMPIVRRGLTEIIDEQADLEVIGEADDLAGVMKLVEGSNCDVLLLDVATESQGHLEALARVRGDHPHLPVLVMGADIHDQSVIRTFKAGAAGYLTPLNTPEELVRALKKVAGGGRFVSETVAEHLAAALGHEDDRPAHSHLSDRELQVLCLIGTGMGVGDIAADLGLSVKTVGTYRARILQKLGKRTTGELVRYAVEEKLHP